MHCGLLDLALCIYCPCLRNLSLCSGVTAICQSPYELEYTYFGGINLVACRFTIYLKIPVYDISMDVPPSFS